MEIVFSTERWWKNFHLIYFCFMVHQQCWCRIFIFSCSEDRILQLFPGWRLKSLWIHRGKTLGEECDLILLYHLKLCMNQTSYLNLSALVSSSINWRNTLFSLILYVTSVTESKYYLCVYLRYLLKRLSIWISRLKYFTNGSGHYSTHWRTEQDKNREEEWIHSLWAEVYIFSCRRISVLLAQRLSDSGWNS